MSSDDPHPSDKKKNPISLSDFFPKDTIYFYGFPGGEDSRFFNQVPPWVEELVAARTFLCAGPSIKVVAFHASKDEKNRSELEKILHTKLIPHEQIVFLPPEITAKTEGKTRNTLIKNALQKLVPLKKLVMAQPLLDEDLLPSYQDDPFLTVKLNDKWNKSLFIPQEYLPEKHKIFNNGQEFFDYNRFNTFPCVVKVSSSSSGDGVRICKNIEDFKQAQVDFKDIKGNLFIEEFIKENLNLCILFGIPYDSQKQIEIIGFNQQFIDDQGVFLGGIVNLNKKIDILPTIYKVLLEEILPHIRAMGWYGIGGMDVLIDKNNNFYFIDPNFRMTGTAVWIFLARNKEIPQKVISFTGKFDDKNDFEDTIFPLAQDTQSQKIKIIALTKSENVYRFNAGIFFDTHEDLVVTANELLKLGVVSNTLKRMISVDYNKLKLIE